MGLAIVGIYWEGVFLVNQLTHLGWEMFSDGKYLMRRFTLD